MATLWALCCCIPTMKGWERACLHSQSCSNRGAKQTFGEVPQQQVQNRPWVKFRSNRNEQRKHDHAAGMNRGSNYAAGMNGGRRTTQQELKKGRTMHMRGPQQPGAFLVQALPDFGPLMDPVGAPRQSRKPWCKRERVNIEGHCLYCMTTSVPLVDLNVPCSRE
eukprot:1152081-Pelagomonas_calceolata.AAC.6